MATANEQYFDKLLESFRKLPKLVDVHQLSEILGVTESSIRKFRYQERIPYLKVGRAIRFDPVSVLECLQKITGRK